MRSKHWDRSALTNAKKWCWRRLVSSRKLLRGPGRLLQGLMGVRVCSLLFKLPQQLGFWLLEASALGGILSHGGVFGARPVPCTPTRQVMQLRVRGPGGPRARRDFHFFYYYSRRTTIGYQNARALGRRGIGSIKRVIKLCIASVRATVMPEIIPRA